MAFPTTAGSLASWTDQNANIPGTGTKANATNVNAIITEVNAITNTIGASAMSLSNLAEDPATTTALIWGYQAGRVVEDNVVRTIAAGHVHCTDNATNYVEFDAGDDTMYVNQTAFTSGRKPIATVITSGGFITGTVSSRDQRSWLLVYAGAPVFAASNYTITGTWTWGAHLLFTDNTYDIGASGATRPRTGYFGTSVYSPIFATGADPADTGAIRLSNGEVIAWEDATECTLTHVDNVGLSLNLALTVGTGLTVTANGINLGADPADAGDIKLSNAGVIAWEDATECTLTHVDNTGLSLNLALTVGTGLTVTAGGATITAGNLGIGAAQQADHGIYAQMSGAKTAATTGISINNIATATGETDHFNKFGLQVVSTGSWQHAGSTNSNYGIYIIEPTGADTNIGLYNAGTTTLVGDVTFSGNLLIGADPADTGAIRLPNAAVIAWEDAAECTLTHVDNVGLSTNLAFSALGDISRAGANAQTLTISQATVSADIGADSGCSGKGTNTITVTTLIPAGSIVLGVTARVTTILAGTDLTTWKLGVGGALTNWGATLDIAATTVSDSTTGTYLATWVPTYYGSATSLVMTANAGVISTGVVRFTVHYIKLTASTS